MKPFSVRWPRAIAGAVVAEAGQIAAAFGWVAFYSHVLNAGQSVAHYQGYAREVAPWVSVIAGVPIFYAAGRWIATNGPSAIALWGVFLLIDGGLLLAAPSDGPLPLAAIALSYLTKLAACYAGGRHGQSAANQSVK